MRKIAVYGKGGIGKSTMSANLSAALAACGSSNSMIELTPAELEEYSKPESWVDVCKPMA